MLAELQPDAPANQDCKVTRGRILDALAQELN
jgi:hypothetical protein